MSHPPYLLQTRRLGMRRYARDDVRALGAVFADPYAAKFYPAMDSANLASIKVAARVHESRREYAGKAGPMLLLSTTAAEFAARSAPS